MTTMHDIPECEHHQLHKLLGGRARLLRSHSPLLPSGGQLLQIHGIGLVAIFAKKDLCHEKNIFQAFDYTKLTKENRKQNYELAFQTGE